MLEVLWLDIFQSLSRHHRERIGLVAHDGILGSLGKFVLRLQVIRF